MSYHEANSTELEAGLQRGAGLMFKKVAGDRRERKAVARIKMMEERDKARKAGGGGAPRTYFRKTSPVRIARRAPPVPSTASTAHSDVFNAPVPDDDDLSYTELFRKYGSHTRARDHLNKIWHAKREIIARGFETETKDYKELQYTRVTGRNARNHGPLSKDEGGFRIPMQPRVSPVKRQRALAMGSPVLDPNAGATSATGADASSEASSSIQTHGAFATSPIKSNRRSPSSQDVAASRAPIMDEQLGAYGLDLNLHGTRRKRRRQDRKERKQKRSATSKAREWKRELRDQRNARLESFRARRREALIHQGIDPDTIDVVDMNPDDLQQMDESFWLKKRTPLIMSSEERRCMHSILNTDNKKAEVNVASKRLKSVSSGIGMSTLQLQIGRPRVRSLVYSANNFKGKALPVDDILKMTFNQRQKSARQARGDRSWGGLEKLYFAQSSIVSLPDNIADLTRLQVLDVHSNNLTELPDSIVKLHYLRELDVSSNRLQKLPACFGKLSNLERLNAMQNRIAYLPDGIHKCKRLKSLLFKSNTVMVMGVFPVPSFQDERVKSWRDDDVWECVDGKWWGKVYKNRRTGTLRRKPPTGATVVRITLDMRAAKTWTGELTDVPTTVKERDKSLDFNKLKKAGAPMYMLRLALRNTNTSEWEVGVDVNGDTYYETCLKDPGEYGQFLNRTYTMPHAMDRVGKLASIEEIDMSMNGVRTIPDSIGRGPLQYRLQSLRLEFNRIRDIPSSLTQLGQMHTLDLSNNLIERLPENIGNCASLRTLRLQFNKLEYVPDSIGKCTVLEQLWLNNNKLVDLPIYLGRCTALTDIKALGNSDRVEKMSPWAEGTKAVLYNFRRLISLAETGPPPSVKLMEIGVGGEVLVPEQRLANIIKDKCNEIVRAADSDPNIDLTALRRKKDKMAKHKNKGRKKGEERDLKEKAGEFDHLTINFNWMGLTAIPPEVLRLAKRLRVLRMVGNNMVDIPVAQLAPLGGLLKLNLAANNLRELPDCFGKMRHLEELNIAENALELIPHSVMRLRNLRKLDAAHNKLLILNSGVGRMKSLRELNLASNVIEDLPKELGSADALRKINLSGNCLRRVPEETGQLFRLRKLNLNFNKLKSVPESFGSLSSLKELHLAANRIKALPKSLGAVVDIEAEYVALAVAPARKQIGRTFDRRGSGGPEIEILGEPGGAASSNKGKIKTKKKEAVAGDGEGTGRKGRENEEEEVEEEQPPDDGGGASFAEKFIAREYEDWRAWAEPQANGTRKRKRLKTSRRQKRGDSVSPYMLLTGIVADACQKGDVLWQTKQLPSARGASASGGSGSGGGGASPTAGRRSPLPSASSPVSDSATTLGSTASASDTHLYAARGIVVEQLSTSAVVVRVTTLGGLVSDPSAFVPGRPIRVGDATRGANLGAPKTATQHQHMLLTLCPERGEDDDDDDDEDGGYIGRFMRRLDQTAWLQQKETGAVGKVIATLCLADAPTLPDLSGVSADIAAEMEAAAEAKATAADVKLSSEQRETLEKAQRDEESMMLDEDERMLSDMKIVSVLVLLLSKEAMFSHKFPLVLHTDAAVEGEPDQPDSEEDEDARFERLHVLPAPVATQGRVKEVVLVGAFDLPRRMEEGSDDDAAVNNDDEDERDPVERGTLVLQSSSLAFAPPSVAVVSIIPSRGADPNLPLDPETRRTQKIADDAGAGLAPEETTAAVAAPASSKKKKKKKKKPAPVYKKKKTEEQLRAEEHVKMLQRRAREAIKNTVRVYALVIQGRPVRHRPCYCMEDFNVDDAAPGAAAAAAAAADQSGANVGADGGVFSRPLGNPLMVRKIMLVPEPDMWMKMQKRMVHVGGALGKSLKRGANTLLVKTVGEQKAIEIEEKALKALEIAEARAVFLKQAAVERSIAMRRDVVSGTFALGKLSQSVGKALKNRAIEQVTGKFQLDEISDDSGKEGAAAAGGKSGDALAGAEAALPEGYKAIKVSSIGMIEGGLKGMSTAQVLNIMSSELEEHAEVLRRKAEEEAAEAKKRKRRGGKMSRKQRKLLKKREEEKRRARPMLLKPSPLANSLSILRLTANRLTEIPETFSHFSALDHVTIDQNPILSPPSDLATMGTKHIRAYFQLRSQRLGQLTHELVERGLKYHADRISPEAKGVIARESRGHLTANDLKAFDHQVDRLVNGQIVAYRYTARRIVKNLCRVAAKRQHWYHQRILRDFLALLRVCEKESLLHVDAFVRKEPRPWGDVPHGMAGPIMVRCYVVRLDAVFDLWYDNPVSIAMMIAERKKLGYDRTGFKWKRQHVEEAVREYKGIWGNSLPVVQFEEHEFEDCVPDPDNKVYDKHEKRMVPKVAKGGSCTAVVVKRVVFTDDEVNRKKAEDAEIKRFSDPKLYRLGLWFETDEGKEKVQARIYEKRTNLREEQAKAQEKAEELAELLAKARKSFFAVKKRKEAFEEGRGMEFHQFASSAECQEKYAEEQELEAKAKQNYNDAVKKMDFVRAMVKRKEHEWVMWAEQTFRDYVVGKVRDEMVLRRRKIANIKGWRRPWDGKEGADFQAWRTGKGCQWHPKFLDEIADLPSDEDSSFTCGLKEEGDGEGKGEGGEEEVWSPLANLKKKAR